MASGIFKFRNFEIEQFQSTGNGQQAIGNSLFRELEICTAALFQGGRLLGFDSVNTNRIIRTKKCRQAFSNFRNFEIEQFQSTGNGQQAIGNSLFRELEIR